MHDLIVSRPSSRAPLQQSQSRRRRSSYASTKFGIMPNTIIIDPNGDITLVLGTQKALVNSTCLRLASPVFKAMLSPKYAEGSRLEKTGATEIALEDDPPAMLVILNTLHLRNRVVPATMEPTELHAVAMLADKYDMVTAILPWARLWLSPWKSYSIDDIQYQQKGYEKMLAVSWIFEEEQIFRKATHKLVLETLLDDEGRMVTREGEFVDEGIPDQVLGKTRR